MNARPESLAYAAHFLRAADRDRYYATLVVPAASRAPIQALHAFAADVASIRERVREPAAGEIRLRWWMDALTGEGHGNVRQNPLADALLGTIEAYRLPAPAFERLLAARRFDLYDDPMPDAATFEGYAGETVSILYQVAAMILNDGVEPRHGDAAGHLGVAHALIGHLRAFGLNASRGRLFLPLEVLARNGVEEREVFAGTVSEGLLEALGQLAEYAGHHLDRARAAVAAVPSPLRPAFAMLALLQAQLRRIPAALSQPFAPPRDIPHWRRIAILVLGAWRLG